MDNYEFVDIAKRIANDIPTKYQLGGWGQQSNGYYLFDCVCLIKSILWGFNFSVGGHGGAIYLANGVPDINANRMIEVCTNISRDFTNIKIGEILWLNGHVGIYAGDRNVVEATTAWLDKVLISYVDSNGARIRDGRQVYTWVKHGKLPYITYNDDYVTITSFEIIEIESRSITIAYTTNIQISEVLYTLNEIDYIPLPSNNIIDNLIPNTDYQIRLKVKRIYSNNYTESNIIGFKTLDEPIDLKYKVGEVVVVNGNLYINATSEEPVDTLKHYVTTITKIDNSYNVLHPYMIDDIGWVDESSIKIYTPPKTNIFKILLIFFIIIMLITLSIFLILLI